VMNRWANFSRPLSRTKGTPPFVQISSAPFTFPVRIDRRPRLLTCKSKETPERKRKL